MVSKFFLMPNSKIKIKEINAKSILQKSGLPDVDWVINPYTGCRFACKYCYAAFVGRFSHPDEPWGSYVDVKINAPELLKKELFKKLKINKKSEQQQKSMFPEVSTALSKQADVNNVGTIFLSSVTDPYQGLEAKYQLTRKCLQVLLDLDYQGKVSILTKSTLVTRDIDLFKQFPNIEVGLTITSTGDPISKYLETYATPHELRLKALADLSAEGINTYSFVGPLLPHFVWQEKAIKQLLEAIKKSGVKYTYIEHLNLTPTIKQRLFDFLKKDHPELIEKFEESIKPEYREKLDKMIYSVLKDIELPLAHEQVIYHKDI